MVADYFSNFLPDKAFDVQVYEMSDRIHPYDKYAAGMLTKNPEEVGAPSTAMKVLRRGRSKRADMFLDWLVGLICVASHLARADAA